MTPIEFLQLSLPQREHLMWMDGVYLLSKYQERYALHLYSLYDFMIEVWYEVNKDKNLEKMPEFATKEALDKVVMESYDFVVAALQGASEAQMGEKVKVFGMDMTRDQAYSKAFEHQTHHRGQATLYLRMKGVKPPNEKLF